MTVAAEPESPQTKSTATGRMKALVYHGPGKRAWEETPRPAIQNATDAIVRITTSTICGTDLHILKGDLPSVTPGRILGHEGIGVVDGGGDGGHGRSSRRPGDHLLRHGLREVRLLPERHVLALPRRGLDPRQHHRRHAGGVRAHPACRHEPLPLPAGGDEEALVMLSDILPTGFECGVLNGQVKPGDTVAIVGAGPIGLAVLLTAQFYSPAAVTDDRSRRQSARAWQRTSAPRP